MSSRKQRIFDAIDNTMSGFFYYDRKDDEDLPRGEIEQAVKSGEITVEELESAFCVSIQNRLKDQ